MLQESFSATPKTRGNQAIAQQTKPGWLNKPQFLEFAGLRAFPSRQIGALCAILHDRALPLDHQAVRILINQSVRHVGEISPGETEEYEWKNDLFNNGGAHLLLKELDELAEEIQGSPHQHGALLLLGELSTIAAQASKLGRVSDVSRNLAAVAQSWALDLDRQIEEADSVIAAGLRAKQSIFYMTALTCFAAGELSDGDVEQMCMLAVQGQSKRFFEVDMTDNSEAALQSLTIMSHAVMLTRGFDIVAILRERGCGALTKAVKLVIEFAPDDLQWKLIAGQCYEPACFEAEHDGQLFSINVITGVVLVNGRPPMRLPSDILRHPLYLRTFGDRDFETCICKDGSLKTVRTTSGCLYQFSLSCENELIVHETGPDGTQLRLLDGTEAAIGKWGSDLPVRLQQMHSHWYLAEGEKILVRGTRFSNRAVHFVHVKYQESNRSKQTGCMQIPVHLRSDWRAVAGQNGQVCPRLIKSEEFDTVFKRISQALGKFEDEAFIHVFENKEGLFVISLPRYDLEFEFINSATRLSSNSSSAIYTIHSRNFKGYALQVCQQLQRTEFLQFEQYLILGSIDESKEQLIIVPEGRIKSSPNCVSVATPSDCAAELKYHKYEVHPRFHYLMATGIEARLQLASLYVATGTMMAGADIAMKLVRGSWVNRPLSNAEQIQLVDIAHQGQLFPALVLLCFELQSSSRQLHFLHKKAPEEEHGAFEIDTHAVADAKTAYANETQYLFNARCALSTEEERRVLARVHPKPRQFRVQEPKAKADRFKASGVGVRAEKQLVALVSTSAAPVSPSTVFPLGVDTANVGTVNTKVCIEMHKDLEQSWEMHSKAPQRTLASQSVCERTIEQLCDDARTEREGYELHITKTVTDANFDDDVQWHAAAFRMHRSGYLAPVITTEDFVHCACVREEPSVSLITNALACFLTDRVLCRAHRC